jgi:hypothetical protein
MKTTIKATVPLTQKIEVTCNKEKNWGTNLINIYTEESYPTQPDREPIGEEITICLDTQADVEKFIALIRKATRKIK